MISLFSLALIIGFFFQGGLGKLGKPGLIIGSDLSSKMVEYCQAKYNSSNMRFEQLDVTKGEQFAQNNLGTFSLVSFMCLLSTYICVSDFEITQLAQDKM